MLGLGRIPLRALAHLARRLATSLEAGIDARRVWAGEVDRASGAARARFVTIRDALASGQSMAEALEALGDYFPPLFRKMVAVGEKTGHLPEVLTRLAAHYENQVRLRGLFLGAIAWPVAELAIAVVVIGLLILVVGSIGEARGMRIDPLGFGLLGVRGLVIYLGIVGAAAAAVLGLVQAARRGLIWVRPVERAAMRVPVLGACLETLALARLTWALHMTLDTQLDVRESVRLGMEAARNAWYADRGARIDEVLSAGLPIAEAFAGAGVFPPEFVAAVAVGEQTGNLVESMGLMAHQYEERARAALATLTTVAGFAVWAVIAAIIVALIFRLAMFYIGMLNDAMRL